MSYLSYKKVKDVHLVWGTWCSIWEMYYHYLGHAFWQAVAEETLLHKLIQLECSLGIKEISDYSIFLSNINDTQTVNIDSYQLHKNIFIKKNTTKADFLRLQKVSCRRINKKYLLKLSLDPSEGEGVADTEGVIVRERGLDIRLSLSMSVRRGLSGASCDRENMKLRNFLEKHLHLTNAFHKATYFHE